MTIFSKILKKTLSTTSEIPKIRYHVSNEVVNIDNDYVCSVIKFDGIVFEAISDNVLENDFDALNLLFAESAKEKAGRIAFYTYLLRREIQIDTQYNFANKFCQDFADKYLRRFNENKYFQNGFYIAILMKYDESIDEAITEINAIVDRFSKTLNKYEPSTLKAFKNEHDVLKSEVFDFFYEIINSEKPIASTPLTGTPAYDVLPDAGLHFGFELLQVKGNHNKYANLYDLKDFPRNTRLGMFNSASLALPFEYNLVQSFVALSPAKAIDRIEKQANRLRLNGDKAEHQQQELIEAKAL